MYCDAVRLSKHGSYSCVRLGWERLSAQAALISRLRLDARLLAWRRRGWNSHGWKP